MSIEGLFLMCLIIGVAILATVAVVILAFLLYSTRDIVETLKKDIDLLETQNIRLKDRVLELEARLDALELAGCKKSRELPNRCYGCKAFEYESFGWGHCKLYNEKIDNYMSCTECIKGGDAECDS